MSVEYKDQEFLNRLAAEYDAAPEDAEWNPPHPIFAMAQLIDQLNARIAELEANVIQLKDDKREYVRLALQSELEQQAERDAALAGWTAHAMLYTAPQYDAELVELLDRIVEHLEYDAIGSPSEAIAGGLAEDLRAKLATLLVQSLNRR